MGKEQDLEKQLEEVRQSKNFLLNNVDNVMTLPDKKKADMWNAVAPIIKSVVEQKIKTGSWNHNEFRDLVFQKALKAVCGEDVFTHLENV